jgi:hypothetical protein
MPKYHAMKVYMGAEVTFHAFLMSILEARGQIHAPAALTTRKDPRYPSDMRLSAPKSQSGEEENSIPAGNRKSVAQPAASHITDCAH